MLTCVKIRNYPFLNAYFTGSSIADKFFVFLKGKFSQCNVRHPILPTVFDFVSISSLIKTGKLIFYIFLVRNLK
jgi:hypothetical protein